MSQIIHVKTQPRPAAKNETPGPSAASNRANVGQCSGNGATNTVTESFGSSFSFIEQEEHKVRFYRTMSFLRRACTSTFDNDGLLPGPTRRQQSFWELPE